MPDRDKSVQRCVKLNASYPHSITPPQMKTEVEKLEDGKRVIIFGKSKNNRQNNGLNDKRENNALYDITNSLKIE